MSGDGVKPCTTCQHPNTAHSQSAENGCLVHDCPCVKWAEPLLSYPINDIEDIICEVCKRVIPLGAPLARHFDAVADDGTLWFSLTCVYCVPASSPVGQAMTE